VSRERIGRLDVEKSSNERQRGSRCYSLRTVPPRAERRFRRSPRTTTEARSRRGRTCGDGGSCQSHRCAARARLRRRAHDEEFRGGRGNHVNRAPLPRVTHYHIGPLERPLHRPTQLACPSPRLRSRAQPLRVNDNAVHKRPEIVDQGSAVVFRLGPCDSAEWIMKAGCDPIHRHLIETARRKLLVEAHGHVSLHKACCRCSWPPCGGLANSFDQSPQAVA